jgi:Protein of unknown function (DUF2946)
MNTSLGAVPELLYCNIGWSGRFADLPAEAHVDMKWFRSNIKRGSRLALFALAIQFVLSFGHFHESTAQAAPSAGKHLARHDVVRPAATYARHGVLHAEGSRAGPAKTSPDHHPDGRPADDCAICAVLALANAMVSATPPYLVAPQAAAFSHLISDVASVDLNSPRVAFQPRAPPIA